MDTSSRICKCWSITELLSLGSFALNEFEQQLLFKRKREIESRLEDWRGENRQIGLWTNITDSWTTEQREQLLSDWNNEKGLSDPDLFEDKSHSDIMVQIRRGKRRSCDDVNNRASTHQVRDLNL